MADDEDLIVAGLRLDALVRGLDYSLVWEADAQTLDFSFVSGRAGKVTGYEAAEWRAAGRRFWQEHVPAGDLERLIAALERAPPPRATTASGWSTASFAPTAR